MTGSLIYQDYIDLYKNRKIIFEDLNTDQIQPSSIDLSLSNECYEIKYSFLAPKNKVRDKLEDLIIKKINLDQKFIFEIDKTYIVKLNEKLNLSDNIFGKCNPKSSTGRLNIFCRTIVDFADEYEKIPKNYKGEIFIEITTRSFNIEFQTGDKLNQLRLVSENNNFLTDSELVDLNIKDQVLFISDESHKIKIEDGIKVSVNLSKSDSISCYVAKKNSPKVCFSKVNYHEISEYWIPIPSKENSIIIEQDKFYILRSKEKVRIPPYLAGEMVPYDTGIGDFRAHYAGFFDPGFGDPNGTYAVLEVKTNELPFLLDDGQTIARIKYEKLNKKSNIVYGSNIKSNYQDQGLKLSKHFK